MHSDLDLYAMPSNKIFTTSRGITTGLFALFLLLSSTNAAATDFAKVSSVSSATVACQSSGSLTIGMKRNTTLFTLLTGWLPTVQFGYRLNLPAGVSIVSPQTQASGLSSFSSSYGASYVNISGALASFVNSGSITFKVQGTKAGTWTINSGNFSSVSNLAGITANAGVTVGACPTPVLNGTITAPASAALNNSFNYNVVITNSGIATVGATTLQGSLPSGLTFVSGSSANGFACAASGQVVTCNRTSSIAQNSTDTLALTVKPTVAGTYNFSMAISGGGSASVNTNTASTTVSTVPDLAVSIAQPAPALLETALSEIPITVTNLGNMATSSPITLNATLPANITAPPKFARNADAWICLTQNAVVTCTHNKTLAAGASSTLRIPVRSAANTAGFIPSPFEALVSQVTGEINTSNNTAPAMTPTTPVAKLALTSITDPLYSAPILDPASIPKYALPLPNALASFFQHSPNTKAYPGTDFYTLDIKQIKTHILPPGFPATDVFAYGDPARPDTFSYPAHTITARSTDPASHAAGLGTGL
ncbi:MAG: hypothetical protein ABL925_20515, partial [Methylococcales bacterium]